MNMRKQLQIGKTDIYTVVNQRQLFLDDRKRRSGTLHAVNGNDVFAGGKRSQVDIVEPWCDY